MRIVATIELDEVWRDIVVLHECLKVFLVKTTDDTEGKPIMHTEDPIDCVL